MEIRFRPEVEAVIRQDVQSGGYENVDEYIEQAVSILHEQESWLAAHRTEIESKIQEGYAAAQRLELLEPKEVRSQISEMKRALQGRRRQE